MSATLDTPPKLRLTADSFYRMGEMGLFGGKNVILVDGELIHMPPEGARHFAAVHRALKTLEGVYPPGFLVRRPGPLQLSLETDPEPDVAVVRGSVEDYLDAHPTHAELVLEVSETSLRYDRSYKLALYAEAKIPEYWIIVLPEQVVEVYRNPVLTPDGWKYGSSARHGRGEQIQPPHAMATVDVSDLMY